MVRNTPEVKQLNTELIRREIQRNEKSTKASISKETGLSVATCNTIINELLGTGEIIQADQETVYMGRPAVRYQYNRDYHHVLVMYISNEQGINKIEYVIADALGNQVQREQISPKTITYDLIAELVGDAIVKDSLIQGMTFGIPGVSHHGVIEYCDVESVVGIDIEGRLKQQFGIDVEVRNDMDFIASGVYHSINNISGNLATVYFPSKSDGCVGCGFVIDGKVLRGSSKFAGEISYAAEAFGVSRKEQQKLTENRQSFIEFVSKAVLIVIATIDPEVIMIIGDNITQEEIIEIQNQCKRVVSEQHIPKLITDSKISEHYLNGLIYTALKQLQFPILE